MPQLFQVLKCYKCTVFQIHQTKKSNKFECKMCGEKQSIKRHYAIGTGKDCRIHVQKLNALRGDMELNIESKNSSDEDYIDIENKERMEKQLISTKNPVVNSESKWSEFIDKEEDIEVIDEPMFLGNREVLLEIPQKRKINNKKHKTKINDSGPHYFSCNSTFQEESECNDKLRSKNFKNCIKPDKTLLSIQTKRINDSAVKKQQSYDAIKVKSPEKPVTFNKNSTWAKYIDTNENEDMHSDVLTVHDLDETTENQILAKDGLGETPYSERVANHSLGKKFSKTDNLFSLCDDNDLDKVLDL